jgi:hypothetical protein
MIDEKITYFCRKIRTMVYELKEFTPEIFDNLLEEIRRKNGNKGMTFVEHSIDGAEYRNEGKKKTLEKHYGSLIRGYDGVEYQRAVRYGTED